jgi:hypothetical protein
MANHCKILAIVLLGTFSCGTPAKQNSNKHSAIDVARNGWNVGGLISLHAKRYGQLIPRPI